MSFIVVPSGIWPAAGRGSGEKLARASHRGTDDVVEVVVGAVSRLALSASMAVSIAWLLDDPQAAQAHVTAMASKSRRRFIGTPASVGAGPTRRGLRSRGQP